MQILILGIALVFLFIICVYPFGVLVGKTFFNFENVSMIDLFTNSSTLTAVANTLIISLGTVLLSTLIALILSWPLTRTDLPGKKTLRSLFCLPYAIPPFISAIAWIYLANPQTGIINKLLGFSLLNIYSYAGLIWAMSSFFYTYILLSMLSALDCMDSSLEEAARLSGASPLKVFFHISLPLVFPSFLSGILLVILASAASFGIPALIGNPARIYMITTKIFTLQKMGTINGIYSGATLSLLLLGMAIIVLGLNALMLRNKFQVVSGKTARPSLIALGIYKWPLFTIICLILFLLLFLPLTAIAISAFSKLQGEISLNNFTIDNFIRIFSEVEETPRALMNSLKLGLVSASIATILGLFLSYLEQKTKIKGRSLISVIVAFPYATPGTVIALALIITFSGNFLGIPISLYNTLTLIALAYVAKYLNFAVRTTGDGLKQIHDCLHEAARISGANWWTTIKTIWIPMLTPSLVASFFLVFMPTFSELTMTILLTGPGLETLGTLLFQLQEYSDISGGGAAVLALFIVLVIAIINYTVKLISKGKYGL